MQTPPPTPDKPSGLAAENPAERREFVRRSVLRANRAIGVILGVVVVLGVVLGFILTSARRSQDRAEKAEAAEKEKVWKASLAQARAENLSTKAGHREAALDAARMAAAIRPSVELRNEAITAFSQRDLVLEREWQLQPNAYGFVLHPDAKYYLVRYQETVLSMFSLTDNSLVREFPVPFIYPKGTNVGDFGFSATGKYTFIRYNGGGLTVWDTENGTMLRIVNADTRAARFSWPVTSSADDRFIGMCMEGSAGLQFVYDIEQGAVRPTASVPEGLKYPGLFNSLVRLSPRGDRLVSFKERNLYIFDAVTGAVLNTVTAPSNIDTVQWDRQGERVAFGCDNYALLVWEPRNGRVVQMGGSAIQPWSMDFSHDGSMLMTAGQDGVTRLWDVVSARLLSGVRGFQGQVMNREASRISGGVPGKSVAVWRIAKPVAMTPFFGSVKERATVWQQDLSLDGRFAVWSPARWTDVRGYELIDLNNGRAVFVPAKQKSSVGFRPGHSQIWRAGPEGFTLRALPPEVPAEAAALETGVQTIPLPRGFIPTQASFTLDGRVAAVSGLNKGLLVMDLAAPDKAVTLEPAYRSHDSIPGPGSPTGAGAMCISPDGRWVAATRYVDRGNPVIWDAHTGKIVQRLPATEGTCAFSPDGRFFANVGQRTGRIWSVGDWSTVWERSRDELLQIGGALAFSGDSSLIAWTRGTTRIELATPAGEALAEWDLAGLNLIVGLRFSADGSRLLATGAEGRMATVDFNLLRRHLAEMKLDWPLPEVPSPAAPVSRSAWLPVLLGIVPVGLAAVLGVLVLRRQGRLTREFVEATEVASQRERELAAERELSELKSRFVTTVSHEFRTPLGITMSAVELLRHYEDRLPPEEKSQLFDDIHTATRNMAALMEQVLVLGRVDAGKLAYRPAPLDLDTLARKLADESLSATNRKCPIEWTPENDLSGAHADEALLRHILANLLSNGVKYSPAGAPVHFSARREGLMAVFTVKDRGIGIPEKDLPQLFEAFHRGSNVGEIPGTGLGLVIIKRCADLHGGSISVSTKPGEGTTFTVRVPAW